MLQKGFLKPRETDENTRAKKIIRMFFFIGIFFVLSGFLHVMVRIKQEGPISILCLILLIIGFLLISVSMWVNFFSQKKKR